MKKIIPLLAFFMFSAAVMAGSDHKHGENHNPEKKMERLTKKLKLTDEQQPQVEAILKDSHEKRKAIDKGEENREKHKALKQQTHQKLSEVLTKEQLMSMKSMHKKQGKKHKKEKDEAE